MIALQYLTQTQHKQFPPAYCESWACGDRAYPSLPEVNKLRGDVLQLVDECKKNKARRARCYSYVQTGPIPS